MCNRQKIVVILYGFLVRFWPPAKSTSLDGKINLAIGILSLIFLYLTTFVNVLQATHESNAGALYVMILNVVFTNSTDDCNQFAKLPHVGNTNHYATKNSSSIYFQYDTFTFDTLILIPLNTLINLPF